GGAWDANGRRLDGGRTNRTCIVPGVECALTVKNGSGCINRFQTFPTTKWVSCPLFFVSFFNQSSIFSRMSNEILSVLEYMEKEKGISRTDMIATIINAILNGAQRGVHSNQELKIEINPRTGALKAWRLLNVVDSVSDQDREIHVEKARAVQADIGVGDVLEQEMDPSF